ncbi:sulfotransferase [Streptomyces sp. LARHCF249]
MRPGGTPRGSEPSAATGSSAAGAPRPLSCAARRSPSRGHRDRSRPRRRHHGRALLPAAVYGCHAFHRERFLRVARRHTSDVTRHFAGRDGDLLVLDIAGGEGYDCLAPFLGLPVPHEPFPHHNRVNRR